MQTFPSEKLLVVGGLQASYYLGVVVGSLAVAAAKCLADGLSESALFMELEIAARNLMPSWWPSGYTYRFSDSGGSSENGWRPAPSGPVATSPSDLASGRFWSMWIDGQKVVDRAPMPMAYLGNPSALINAVIYDHSTGGGGGNAWWKFGDFDLVNLVRAPIDIGDSSLLVPSAASDSTSLAASQLINAMAAASNKPQAGEGSVATQSWNVGNGLSMAVEI